MHLALHRTRSALAAFVAAFALVGSTLAAPVAAATLPGAVSLDSSLKIHPLLQYGAQADPSALVRVIVQKTRADVKVDQLQARLPALQVTEEFQVIPAFVAYLPQIALADLAADPGVRYISPDGAVQVSPAQSTQHTRPAPRPKPNKPPKDPNRPLDDAHLETTYPIDTGASTAWDPAQGHPETGAGISIAVIDSGVDASHPDLAGRVLAVNMNRNSQTAADGYGHGTHVAGILAGHDGAEEYLGIAPNANVISVKVADDNGNAYTSDLLRGMEWVLLNRAGLKIRALNLSVSVSIPESYATSPVDAAVERLWDAGVAVVASAGNLGTSEDAVWYAPGNDPLAITVGCLDENGTPAPGDDSLCPISSRGLTEDGFAKPDLVAPGRKIVSALAAGMNGRGAGLRGEFPERVSEDGRHISLSGTSMSAPMVTGAIALLLDRHDGLSPSQLKQLLVQTARTYAGQPDGAGALNIVAALAASDHPPANKDLALNPVGGTPPPGDASTVLWDGARWTTTYWDGARWTGAYWDGARWTGARWTGARWTSAYWDGARWTGARWTGARWTASAS